MKIDDEMLKGILESYFQKSLSAILPTVIKDVVSNNSLFAGQDFIPLREVMQRYQLSRRTIYNYHARGYITLHSTEGKTFVSIKELENHIKSNPIARRP